MKKRTIFSIVTGLCLMLGVTGCGRIENKTYAAVDTTSLAVIEETKEKAEENTTNQSLTESDVEKESTENTGGQVITFTDDLGREVTVESHDRVATLMGSFSDIWYLAGGEVVATSKDTWVNFDLGLSEDVVNLGGMSKLDTELLIDAAPDFVIASAKLDDQIALTDILGQAGAAVAYFDVNNFNDYLRVLEILTNVTGKTENYDTYGLKVKEEIDHTIARADGSNPTVLYLRATSDKVMAKGSEGNVGSEILNDLGCINIADSDKSLLEELSLEEIVVQDPEYIFVVTHGEDTEQALKVVEEVLLSNPAWSSLTAVKEGKYYVLDKNLYNTKPNARWGEAYEKLADILYGEE